MLSRFYRRKLLNFKVIRALDYLIRFLLSVFPLLHTKLKKPLLIKNPKYYFLIINGGLGDFIIHYNLLNKISSKNTYVVLNKNSQELSKLLFPQINFLYYDNINFDFFKKLKKFTSNISKESLFIFSHPIIENYLIFLFFGFNKAIGFIGNFSKIRSINYKTEKTGKLLFSSNAYERIDSIIKFLNIKINKKNNFSLNNSFEKSTISNFILINPNKTSFWPAGRWNNKGFIEVIKYILSKNYNVVLIGSNDEYLNNEELKIHVNNRKIINLASETNMSDLFNIVKKAKVVVTNDNSTSHIAALLGKKVITLFSFSDPKSFSPPKSINIFNKKYDCMPCVKSTNSPHHNYVVICPYNSRCDKTISSRQVINELDKII